ncbi:S1/P1 nuclease [Bowmanella sp. JS7-9]|uniref:S1/P1 nuclease n=1 Tax=Pseudobowmanella zhangzhouensis TaxID=1537679 RepID=A0ABW1XM55_9ALTE|nr:S1/P1 nuclease [Bowmanella sp. JS7-9]TBX22505.1 hypothetical protein TK45_08640 [Bowmanella sp. JS7-9]
MIRFLALLLTFSCVPALAMSLKGHQTVAHIAYAQLNPTARAQVASLLTQLNLANLAEASGLADITRQLPQYADTQSWHEWRVPAGTEQLDLARDCAQMCIVRALHNNLLLLREESGEKQALALAYVTHLMADLHQPMHINVASAFSLPSVDRWQGQPISRYDYWDSAVLANEPFAERLALNIRGQFSHEEQVRWQVASLMQIAQESFNKARSINRLEEGAISANRFRQDNLYSRQRILQAGLRLAHILNQLWPETHP